MANDGIHLPIFLCENRPLNTNLKITIRYISIPSMEFNDFIDQFMSYIFVTQPDIEKYGVVIAASFTGYSIASGNTAIYYDWNDNGATVYFFFTEGC